MGVTTVLYIIYLNTVLTSSAKLLNFNTIQPSDCQKESVISCKYVALDTNPPKWSDEITLPSEITLETLKIKSRSNSSAIFTGHPLIEAYFIWTMNIEHNVC